MTNNIFQIQEEVKTIAVQIFTNEHFTLSLLQLLANGNDVVELPSDIQNENQKEGELNALEAKNLICVGVWNQLKNIAVRANFTKDSFLKLLIEHVFTSWGWQSAIASLGRQLFIALVWDENAKETVAALVKSIESSSPEIKNKVADILRTYGWSYSNEESLGDLINIAKAHWFFNLNSYKAEIWSYFPKNATHEVLTDALIVKLNNEELSVRHKALRELIKIIPDYSARNLIERLVKALISENGHIQLGVAVALGRIAKISNLEISLPEDFVKFLLVKYNKIIRQKKLRESVSKTLFYSQDREIVLRPLMKRLESQDLSEIVKTLTILKDVLRPSDLVTHQDLVAPLWNVLLDPNLVEKRILYLLGLIIIRNNLLENSKVLATLSTKLLTDNGKVGQKILNFLEKNIDQQNLEGQQLLINYNELLLSNKLVLSDHASAEDSEKHYWEEDEWEEDERSVQDLHAILSKRFNSDGNYTNFLIFDDLEHQLSLFEKNKKILFFLEALQNPDWRIVTFAAQLLSEICIRNESHNSISTPEIIRELVKCLTHQNIRVRCAAALTLGKLGNSDRIVLKELLDLLKFDETIVRFAAMYALVHLDVQVFRDEVITTLTDLIIGEDKDLSFAAAVSLGSLFGEPVVREILDTMPKKIKSNKFLLAIEKSEILKFDVHYAYDRIFNLYWDKLMVYNLVTGYQSEFDDREDLEINGEYDLEEYLEVFFSDSKGKKNSKHFAIS